MSGPFLVVLKTTPCGNRRVSGILGSKKFVRGATLSAVPAASTNATPLSMNMEI